MVGPSGSGEKAGSKLEMSTGPSYIRTQKAAAVPVRTKSGLKRKPGPGRTCNKFTKTGRMRQCRDPAAPKRARTAFNFFLRDFRKKYLVSHQPTYLDSLPAPGLAMRGVRGLGFADLPNDHFRPSNSKAEHPETTGVIEVTKNAAAAWRSMTKEDKKDYDAMALVEKVKALSCPRSALSLSVVSSRRLTLSLFAPPAGGLRQEEG